LHFIVDNTGRIVSYGTYKYKYGWLIRVTYEILCACRIHKKMNLNMPILLNEIYDHWKRLWLDDDNVLNEGQPNISLLPLWDFL